MSQTQEQQTDESSIPLQHFRSAPFKVSAFCSIYPSSHLSIFPWHRRGVKKLIPLCTCLRICAYTCFTLCVHLPHRVSQKKVQGEPICSSQCPYKAQGLFSHVVPTWSSQQKTAGCSVHLKVQFNHTPEPGGSCRLAGLGRAWRGRCLSQVSGHL